MTDIARELGCSLGSVRHAYQKFGIEGPRNTGRLGQHLTTEQKKQLSDAMTGRTRLGQSCALDCDCKRHSLENRNRSSEALKRQWQDPAKRQLMSNGWAPESRAARITIGMAGKTHTEETKAKISASQKGHAPSNLNQSVSRVCHYPGCEIVIVTSPAFARIKGCSRAHGRIPGPNLPYSPEWPRVRVETWERDKYTCVLCGKAELKRPEAHHLNYDKSDCRPENLVTLCSACHQSNHRKGSWPLTLSAFAPKGPLL